MDIKVKVKDFNKFRNDIIKELMPKGSKITVGVIERPHAQPFRTGKSEHSKGGALYRATTTQIAAAHEYGLSTPRRSFIRDTINRWLFKDVGSLANRNYKRIDFFLRAISNKVYERVQEAFDTNGWGQWKALSEEYKRRTGRTDEQILVDTGQLRAAIYTEYAGETTTGKKISGGHSAQRSDTGKYRPYGKMWLQSLYGNVTSFFKR